MLWSSQLVVKSDLKHVSEQLFIHPADMEQHQLQLEFLFLATCISKSNIHSHFWYRCFLPHNQQKYLSFGIKLMLQNRKYCLSVFYAFFFLQPYILNLWWSLFQTSVKSRQPHFQPKQVKGKKKKMCHHLQKEKTQLQKVSLCIICLYMCTNTFVTSALFCVWQYNLMLVQTSHIHISQSDW